MADDYAVKIMSRLGLDFSQAIASAGTLENQIKMLDNSLLAIQVTAKKTQASMGTLFAQNLDTVQRLHNISAPTYKDIVAQTSKLGTLTTKQVAEQKRLISLSTAYLKNQITDTDLQIKKQKLAQQVLITKQKELTLQNQLNAAKAKEAATQAKTASAATATATANAARGTTAGFNVVQSQIERRASWFVAGSAFFGAIRAMREMVGAMSEVEQGMIVIARTSNDITFNLEEMRGKLMEVGKAYGYTWETVQDISIKWTQAGYNVNDTLELTRLSLLSLNVAEMDVQMATQGLISVMAQWGFEANELEGVIDKLNVTSDNYAVTTGDLMEALVRTSGAARAMGLEFDETVGLVTAMRVASGRLGREVGNAMNTILSYITRQSTLNKLQEAGIKVFKDELGNLVPVMDIFSAVVERWGDNAEQIPAALIDIAEEMGVMGEEIAEVMGLQEDWNDLQRIEIETSMAGVRRRNYLIAMLRNFAMAQEVVVNMQEREGYSMTQNEKTMETLEKKYDSLKMAAAELAIAIGDAGLRDALKGLVDVGTMGITEFGKLDDTVKSLAINLGLLYGSAKAIGGIAKMLGLTGGIKALISAISGAIKALSAGAGVAGAAGALGAAMPWGLVAAAVAAVGLTAYNSHKKSTEAAEKHTTAIGTLGEEYYDLKDKLRFAEKGTDEYVKIQDKLQKTMDGIVDIQPNLLKSLGEQARISEINEVALDKEIKAHKTLITEKENLINVQKSASDIADAIEAEKEKTISNIEAETALLEKLVKKYYEYILRSEERIAVEQAIIAIIGEKAWEEIKESDDIETALRAEIIAREDLVAATQQAAIDSLTAERDRLTGQLSNIDEEIKALDDLRIARENAYGEPKDLTPKKKLERILEPDILFADEETGGPNWFTRLMEGIFGEDGMLKKYADALPEIGELFKDPFSFSGKSPLKDFVEGRLTAEDLFNVDELREGIGIDTEQDQKLIDEAAEALNEKLKARAQMQAEFDELIKKIAGDIADTATEDGGGDGDEGSGLSKTYDITIDRYMRLNSVLDDINNAIDLNATLQKRASGVDTIRYIENENKLLRQKTDALHLINEERRKERDELKATLSSRGFAFDEQGDITNYEARLKAISNATNAMAEGSDAQKKAKDNAIESVKELEKSIKRYIELVYNEIPATSTELHVLFNEIENNVDAMQDLQTELKKTDLQHWAKMGVYAVQEQIDILREMYDMQKMSTEEIWKLDEEIFDKYKDALKEQRDELKDAYDERIEQINNEADAAIEAKRRELEALEEEDKASDREEAERQHQLKMQELAEERQYHEVRTGEEHRKAIIDLDKEMEEELKRWELQQEEWAREDKKEVLNKEIEDIKEQADKEVAAWKESYEEVLELFEGHNADIIAYAAMTSKEAWEEWKINYFDKLKKELTSGSLTGFQSILHDWGMSDADYRRFIENGERWMELFNQGHIESQNEEMQRLREENDNIRKRYGRDPALGEYPEFHTGAKTLSYGMAMFKPGELIFPPDLSEKMEALLSFLRITPSSQIDKSVDNSRSIQIRNLLNIESNHMSDEVDSEILARQLKRAVSKVY